MVMTEEVAGISRWWIARQGEGRQFSILNFQFLIIGAGGRRGSLGRGARDWTRAAGIQNAELELGGPRERIGAELGLGGLRFGAQAEELLSRTR